MLGLKIRTKQKKGNLEEMVRKIQSGDTKLLNEFIDSYKPFIAKTVSSVCKRYIDETDDEFSIGLIAFNDAIQKYTPDKGASILSFAEVIIKNRVIDYIRKQAKYQSSTIHFNSVDESDDQFFQNSIEADISYQDFREKNDEMQRKEEITRYSLVLSKFKLSFKDLVKESPKHADARKNAMLIAQTVASNEELINYLLEKKRLPIKHLETKVNVSRKTIERNRKYIIAITLIFIGDYYYLKDYIKGVLET